MSYSGAFISALLVLIVILLLFFPEYSKRKFLKNNRDIRSAGILMLVIAMFFLVREMHTPIVRKVLEFLNQCSK